MTVAILEYTLRSSRNDNGEISHSYCDLVPDCVAKPAIREHEEAMARQPGLEILTSKMEVAEYFAD